MIIRKRNSKFKGLILAVQIGMMMLALVMVLQTILNFRDQGTRILAPFFSGGGSAAGIGSLVWHWCSIDNPGFEASPSTVDVTKLDARNICRIEVTPSPTRLSACDLEILKANGAVSGRAPLLASISGDCFQWQDFFFTSAALKSSLTEAGVIWKDP